MGAIAIAVILGIVEGLTEFIPVSSTGHLIVVGDLLGFTGPKASTFEVAIQLGAILSVVVLYRKRFLALIPGVPSFHQGSGSTLEGWSGLWLLIVATIPAGLVGYAAHGFIKAHLFRPITVSWALLIGGIGILIAEKFTARRASHSIDTVTLTQAFGIGLFQALSVWPGTSRAAATIVGGLLLGLDRKGAAEFSFLMAVPIMVAATGYDFLKLHAALTPQDMVQFGVGFVVSFMVALMAVATFIRMLSRWSLAPFGWYRIVAAPAFYLLTRGLAL